MGDVVGDVLYGCGVFVFIGCIFYDKVVYFYVFV